MKVSHLMPIRVRTVWFGIPEVAVVKCSKAVPLTASPRLSAWSWRPWSSGYHLASMNAEMLRKMPFMSQPRKQARLVPLTFISLAAAIIGGMDTHWKPQ